MAHPCSDDIFNTYCRGERLMSCEDCIFFFVDYEQDGHWEGELGYA
jgi:hypothetical protein